MTDIQPVERMRLGRVLPVVALNEARHAEPLGDALVKGGLGAIEMTLRTEAGLTAVATLAARGDLTVVAGTVLTAAQADRVIAAGARCVVTPGFAPAVVRVCQDAGVPVVPGVATATEIQMALDAGVSTVKFFPAQQLGGPGMIKALAAPFRDVRFIPTGGVTPEVIADYLAVPAVTAVGMSWIATAELIGAERWDEITTRTATALATAAGSAS